MAFIKASRRRLAVSAANPLPHGWTSLDHWPYSSPVRCRQWRTFASINTGARQWICAVLGAFGTDGGGFVGAAFPGYGIQIVDVDRKLRPDRGLGYSRWADGAGWCAMVLWRQTRRSRSGSAQDLSDGFSCRARVLGPRPGEPLSKCGESLTPSRRDSCGSGPRSDALTL
jgi:hypothetical protein